MSITEIAVIITAVGAAVVNVIVALRTNNSVNRHVLRTIELQEVVQEVKVATNGQSARINAELAASRSRVTELLETITDLKCEQAAMLAARQRATRPLFPSGRVLQSGTLQGPTHTPRRKKR